MESDEMIRDGVVKVEWIWIWGSEYIRAIGRLFSIISTR